MSETETDMRNRLEASVGIVDANSRLRKENEQLRNENALLAARLRIAELKVARYGRG